MLTALSVDVEFEIIALEHGIGEEGQQDFASVLSSTDVISSEEVDRLFEAWTIEEAQWMGSSEGSATDESSLMDRLDLTAEGTNSNFDDSVNFLSSVFPKLRRSTLFSRVEETPDLETLMELLLNEEFISATENTFPDAPAFNFADFEMETGMKEMGIAAGGGAARKKARKREKTALKASQVLSLTDVLHRSPVPSPAIASLTAILPNVFHAPSDTNRWINMDSTSSYLALLLHIPPGRITSAYHRMDSNLPLAIDSLLTTLENERPFIEIPDHERLLTELSIVLPTHSLSGLMRLLSATEGDPSDALDLKLKLEEIAREEGSLLMNGLFGFGGGGDKRRVVVVQENSTLKPIIDAPTIIPGFQGWKKVSASSSSGSTSSSRYASSSTTNTSFSSTIFIPSDWSATECENQADEYLTKRNDAFRAAARAIQLGGVNRAGAGHFAEQGREYDRKRKIWEQRRAFAVVGERR